jgi:GNAT superfamily N-acetyltransferase
MVSIRPFVPGQDEAVTRTLGLARLNQGDGFYLVAWEGSEAVGHVHLALTSPPEIQDLDVLAHHRRRGVARALIAAAEAELRARGSLLVRLELSVDDRAASSLYLSCGYVDAGLPVRRVKGTVALRLGLVEVDDVLATSEKQLAADE